MLEFLKILVTLVLISYTPVSYKKRETIRIHVFIRNLDQAPETISFLIQHENLSILVSTVFQFVSYFLNA